MMALNMRKGGEKSLLLSKLVERFHVIFVLRREERGKAMGRRPKVGNESPYTFFKQKSSII